MPTHTLQQRRWLMAVFVALCALTLGLLGPGRAEAADVTSHVSVIDSNGNGIAAFSSSTRRR